MAQKLARTQGTSRRGLNIHSMDYQVTYRHSLRSAPEDFIVHVPSQMVCNVPATVDQIIQRLCPSGVLPQSAFGGNRRCRRCAGLQGDAIFSSLRVRSGRRPAGSLNATQLIRLISIETTGKRRNERRAAVLTAASELRGVDRPSYLPLHFRTRRRASIHHVCESRGKPYRDASLRPGYAWVTRCTAADPATGRHALQPSLRAAGDHPGTTARGETGHFSLTVTVDGREVRLVGTRGARAAVRVTARAEGRACGRRSAGVW